MRASRLVSIVLLLQRHGQMRATELADTLEVTQRTIYRDIVSLSAAGVPIVGEPGNHGGYHLLDGYRTRLTGLSAEEAKSMFLTGVPAAAAALGLDDQAASAQLKLLAAVTPDVRARAEHARQRVYLDPTPWGGTGQPDPWLPKLHEAIWSDTLVKVRYGTARRSLQVAPLGLVCKGAAWYLIGRRGTATRTYRVTRIRDLTITGQPFERPASFDLVTHWHDTVDAYTDTFPRTHVTLRLRGEALIRAGWVQARTKSVSEPDPAGWATVELELEDEDNALTVIRILGNDSIVVSPRSLREKAVATAQAFADANTKSSADALPGLPAGRGLAHGEPCRDRAV
jgi:predicted DNA-binding transcriptional regulator YafY